MKKQWSNKCTGIILILCLMLSMLGGCAQVDKKPSAAETTDAPQTLYASFYPIYALTHMLVENVPDIDLKCLVQPQDGCLRSYQLSEWDLALLTASADAFIIGGCGLEGFESLLYALGENGPAVAALLYDMELTEQMAANTQEDTESHWVGKNPHVYMKTDGALELLKRIEADLRVLDPENAEQYTQNFGAATKRLEAVQAENIAMFSGIEKPPVILMNEALVYCAEEYGLDTALCYERESGEGMDAYELEECLQYLKNSGADVILIEKQAPQELCTALESEGYILARMDTLSTRRSEEGSDGFIAAMQENALVLHNAFEVALTKQNDIA